MKSAFRTETFIHRAMKLWAHLPSVLWLLLHNHKGCSDSKDKQIWGVASLIYLHILPFMTHWGILTSNGFWSFTCWGQDIMLQPQNPSFCISGVVSHYKKWWNCFAHHLLVSIKYTVFLDCWYVLVEKCDFKFVPNPEPTCKEGRGGVVVVVVVVIVSLIILFHPLFK